MSASATDAVWASTRQTGSALVVLLALARAADERGVADLSISTLADRCRTSPRTVQRLISQLLESGEIELLKPAYGPSPPNYQLTGVTISTPLEHGASDLTPPLEVGMTRMSPLPLERGMTDMTPPLELGMTQLSPLPPEHGVSRM
jgi:hypothetical protein